MWSLDACDWYKNGTPLIRYLAEQFYEREFDQEISRGVLFNGDSNTDADILQMAKDIEALK